MYSRERIKMDYKKIVVAGGGILGSQIAFQSAYCGFDVTILIRKEDSKSELKEKLKTLYNTYVETIEVMSNAKKKDLDSIARGIATSETFDESECLNKVEKAANSIKIETDQAKALKDADLVIESITENFDIKKEFYKQIGK